ncbi:MAG: response regulator [Lachnospiraceae bacterium]|nr:response regulator [Lachnospiraceae bacterium]
MYASAAIVSLILFGMGTGALILGISRFRLSDASFVARRMFYIFACVFIWDAGYAWMGLCYDSPLAYVARAIALSGVILYMIAVLEYVGELSHYPRVSRYSYYVVYCIASVISLIKISGKDSVTFQMTPWGYWFVSKLSWGRYVQFGCILVSILFYFVILSYWKHSTMLSREHMIIKRFMLFAPIMFFGYIFDTLLPSMYDMAAIPGSAVAAFISAMLLYGISRHYKAFGINEDNISQYVFRDVSVPVLVMDAGGRIVLWNKVANEYFGRTDDELRDHTEDELFSLPDEDELIEEIEGEEVYVVPDRDEYCRLTRTEYYDDFNDLMYRICFVQDVTDMRIAMREMCESIRTAEEASAAKSIFLANMSHEIRTPLNAIIGISDILLADPDTKENSKQQIRHIHEAGDSLLGIVNDVLDISKIESGHSDMVDNEYSLPDMLHAIGGIIRVKMVNTPLQYIVEADPDMPKMMIGDEMRIRQMYLNILTNSIDFTENGYVHLKIWGEREYGGIRVYTDISDTGSGMHAEDAYHIFDAFSQSSDTHRKRNSGGAGLGLSISLKLARAMDGNITVDTSYGHGTTFHINYFQRLGNDEPIGEEIARAIRVDSYEFKDKEDSFVITKHPGKKVMVVDDSKVNLMVAKGLLAPYDMEVSLVGSGREAVDLAAAQRFDMILMDHMMPEMDGVETLHAIRELGGFNLTVPVIALTANAIDGNREMLLAEGMQDFIKKPIDKKILNDIIDKYC